MAKVIHTPVVGTDARRTLPVEHSVPDKPVQHDAPAGDAAAPISRPIDAHEARRIIAQREAAEGRADVADAALREIQNDMDQLRSAAHEQGYEAGLQQALEQAAEQHESEAEQFRTVCSNLVEQQRERVSDAEEAAVEIAFAATVKLLGRLNSDISLLKALVRQSMAHVLAQQGLKIYLSPADCKRMRALARRKSQDWVGVEFEADGRIQMGGCRIESRAGSLDARLELQMDKLKKALLHTARPAGKRDV